MLLSMKRLSKDVLAQYYGFISMSEAFGGIAVAGTRKELAIGFIRTVVDTRTAKVYLVRDRNPSQDHIDVALEIMDMTLPQLRADPQRGEHLVSIGIVISREGVTGIAVGMSGSLENVTGRHKADTLAKARVIAERFVREGDIPIVDSFEIRISN